MENICQFKKSATDDKQLQKVWASESETLFVIEKPLILSKSSLQPKLVSPQIFAAIKHEDLFALWNLFDFDS